MSDLISTQESIAKIVDTAIRKILSGEQKLTKEYEQSVKDAVNVILDMARREAQDEIVRCKDCEYAISIGTPDMMCKNPKAWVVATDDDFGCVLAERKTDE